MLDGTVVLLDGLDDAGKSGVRIAATPVPSAPRLSVTIQGECPMPSSAAFSGGQRLSSACHAQTPELVPWGRYVEHVDALADMVASPRVGDPAAEVEPLVARRQWECVRGIARRAAPSARGSSPLFARPLAVANAVAEPGTGSRGTKGAPTD
ncbi:hypothetical protein DMH08_15380 [Actinomadura sp. WAC 06369]|nr:hypothetical protein DMH08_15380 [Actinomadura sp. WAC 06369]